LPPAGHVISDDFDHGDILGLAQHRQRIDDGVIARHRRCRDALRPANAVGSARQEDVSCARPHPIVWKDTGEARRAVSVALPLLKRTKDATIVEIVAEGNDTLLTWVKQPMPRCG